MDKTIQEPHVFEEMGRMHMMLVQMDRAIMEKDKQIEGLTENKNEETPA